MAKPRVQGVSRGVVHEKCGTDEWRKRQTKTAGISYDCAECDRIRSRESWRRRRSKAAVARDQKIAKVIEDKPGDELVTLQIAPLKRVLDRLMFGHFMDGKASGIRDVLTDAQVRAYYRALKQGSITVKQAEPILDHLELHGRELWTDEWDRAVWGGALPPDFVRSDDMRRSGRVEQARASFAKVHPLESVSVYVQRQRRVRLRHTNRSPR